ncbi:hypothetical protein PROFUN_00617 [Planoprotostelium fungivorum]|uniref:Uncharacterized protein n=1 Tax=Planoprotostelium fungivorum TaxID=1890364 RepID=A0A2P6NTZ1_9EUKA|nr:hypothetical protein PROFUN_00617 [Planoprotostelium fungivorum]
MKQLHEPLPLYVKGLEKQGIDPCTPRMLSDKTSCLHLLMCPLLADVEVICVMIIHSLGQGITWGTNEGHTEDTLPELLGLKEHYDSK